MQNRNRLFTYVMLLGLMWPVTTMAQGFQKGDNEGSVRTNSFWSNWFVQVDLDMSLQNPYGYNFADVFPNGKSFGLDVALGKWFAPQTGVRWKLNWENGIPLFRNDHAAWLAPFGEPGVNMDKGGYMAMYGDLLVNLHHLFGDYKADRTWNLSVYPRTGVNYNFGVSKGALLAGVGVLNTYRFNEKWSAYADVAYVLTGSGFVGNNETGGTGTGSNSNGYFSIGLGAQYELSAKKDRTARYAHSVQTNGFWQNWFLQVGMDMNLMNPYGCNFSEVFPKGKTFGLDGALGKWFAPEFGIRGRLNWENGLLKNSHLEWVPPTGAPEKNYESGGFAVGSIDALLNVTNAAVGYDEDKQWHTNAYVRAGLIRHFETGSASPLLGAGLEETYRLNDRLSLYGDLGYQVTTSESSGGIGTGMGVSAGSNGFFNIEMGVVVDLGKNNWKK